MLNQQRSHLLVPMVKISELQNFGEYEILQINQIDQPKGKNQLRAHLIPRKTRVVCRTNVEVRRLRTLNYVENLKYFGRNNERLPEFKLHMLRIKTSFMQIFLSNLNLILEAQQERQRELQQRQQNQLLNNFEQGASRPAAAEQFASRANQFNARLDFFYDTKKQFEKLPFNINSPLSVYRPEISQKCRGLICTLQDFRKKNKIQPEQQHPDIYSLANRLSHIHQEDKRKKKLMKSNKIESEKQIENFFLKKQQIWLTLNPHLRSQQLQSQEKSSQQKLEQVHNQVQSK